VRKIVVFLGVLAILGLMMGPALANEVANGDFESINGAFFGWTNPTNGHQVMENYSGAGGTFVGFNRYADNEKGIQQVIDESQFSGWLPNGTGKIWSFSVDRNQTGFGTMEVLLYYLNYNGAIQPGDEFKGEFSSSNWVNFLDHDFLMASGGDTGGWVTYSTNSVITAMQPQWIGVVLECQPQEAGGHAYFDNVVFNAQCVPVPPAVWLFGSGLLGLVGWRRFKA
jgi:hypothetical protein